MRKARMDIAGTALDVRPLGRPAEWSCISVIACEPNLQLEARLIRKATT